MKTIVIFVCIIFLVKSKHTRIEPELQTIQTPKQFKSTVQSAFISQNSDLYKLNFTRFTLSAPPQKPKASLAKSITVLNFQKELAHNQRSSARQLQQSDSLDSVNNFINSIKGNLANQPPLLLNYTPPPPIYPTLSAFYRSDFTQISNPLVSPSKNANLFTADSQSVTASQTIKATSTPSNSAGSPFLQDLLSNFVNRPSQTLPVSDLPNTQSQSFSPSNPFVTKTVNTGPATGTLNQNPQPSMPPSAASEMIAKKKPEIPPFGSDFDLVSVLEMGLDDETMDKLIKDYSDYLMDVEEKEKQAKKNQKPSPIATVTPVKDNQEQTLTTPQPQPSIKENPPTPNPIPSTLPSVKSQQLPTSIPQSQNQFPTASSPASTTLSSINITSIETTKTVTSPPSTTNSKSNSIPTVITVSPPTPIPTPTPSNSPISVATDTSTNSNAPVPIISPPKQLSPCTKIQKNGSCSQCIDTHELFNGACIDKCIQKDKVDNTKCLRCLPQYLIFNNFCITNRDPNCVQLNPDQTCRTCSDRYFYSLSTKICEKASQNCASYTKDGRCTSCVSNLLLSNGDCIQPKVTTTTSLANCRKTDNGKCIMCVPGTFLTAEAACRKIDTNCLEFNFNTKNCGRCKPGFKSQGTDCIAG